jgi:hypothetical protein
VLVRSKSAVYCVVVDDACVRVAGCSWLHCTESHRPPSRILIGRGRKLRLALRKKKQAE